MGFLLLAMLALGTAAAQGHHTVGTLGSLLFGVLGAGVCSVRGVSDARARGLAGLIVRRRP